MWKKFLFLGGIFIFIFFISSYKVVEAATEIDDSCAIIGVDTVWTRENSPYVVYSDLFIDSGVKLTLEAGTVVKLKQSSIVVQGELIVEGEYDEKVIFTSIFDDLRMEDNSPDSTRIPDKGDWGGIMLFEGSKFSAEYLVANYGGMSMMVYDMEGNSSDFDFGAISADLNSTVEISNSEIMYNGIGILSNISSFVIEDSVISDNDRGIVHMSEAELVAINNHWGAESGPYHEIKNPEGEGDSVEGNVLFEPWDTKVTNNEPLILIPGMIGSMPALDGDYILDPILHTYDNLIEALLGAGYELDETLFTFPYDWHNTNYETSAFLLKEKIDEVQEKTGSSKVDIVAHSMGGLVSRYYIQSKYYEYDIDQLIFLDTPHNGSPESYLAYEGAYMGDNILAKVKEYAFRIEAGLKGYLSLTEYIRNEVASVYQLLPTYEYLMKKENDDWEYLEYNLSDLDIYPRNSFLEEMNEEQSIEKLKNRVDVTNIYSYQSEDNTIESIQIVDDPSNNDVFWNHGYPWCLDSDSLDCLVLGRGDGTVPEKSLKFLDGVVNIEIADTSHRGLVTGAQKEVVKTLLGEIPDNYYSGPWGAVKRVLFFRVYSPVDFQVIAPDGKKIGKDFANQNKINEIEGAYYSGFDTEAEYVVILAPIDGEYEVLLEGVGDGKYTLGVDELQVGSSTEENMVTGFVSEGEMREYKINYNQEEQNNFDVEEVRDCGVFDCTIEDVNHLFDTGQISKKNIRNRLVRDIERIQRKYDTMKKTDFLWLNSILKFKILQQLKHLDWQLGLYFKKDILSEDAYNILLLNQEKIINYIDNN